MSLLGRLEDLSLPDIVQIVFLSRRTGVLEIITGGRHTVLFRQGLVVNAAGPQHPDLVTWLQSQTAITDEICDTLRTMEEDGIAPGIAAVEMNVLSMEKLGDLIRARIIDVIEPLLQAREGEFNFILSDAMTAADMEYDPDAVFKEGGIPPPRLLGAGEGEKIKPLQGLEDSLRAGKALLRGSTPVQEPAPASLSIGLGTVADAAPRPAAVRAETSAAPAAEGAADESAEPPRAEEQVSPFDQAGTGEVADDNVLPFPPRDEIPFAEPERPEPGVAEETAAPLASIAPAVDEPPVEIGEDTLPQTSQSASATAAGPRRSSSKFKVAGGLFEVERPDAQYRNVVLLERNPLIRVAAKRAFARQNIKIFQYGSIDDLRDAITDLLRSNSFFVTFLELANDDASLRLMQQLKRKNARLPVVFIDNAADLRRRHDLLRAGADLYLTKPSAERLQPGLAEEELSLFADELVLFSERAFEQWEQVTGSFGAEAGRRFYELAGKESVERSFGVLKQLINELSNPNDIEQVASTILRLSSQYLDRGALFVVGDEGFVGLGGFGVTGTGEAMDARLKRLTIPRNTPSLFEEVAGSSEAHRGKMKKTAANVTLIHHMGGILPTEVVALPIVQSSRTIGILYGDNAEHRAPIDDVAGLEIFLSQSGYAFGNAVFAAERARRT